MAQSETRSTYGVYLERDTLPRVRKVVDTLDEWVSINEWMREAIALKLDEDEKRMNRKKKK